MYFLVLQRLAIEFFLDFLYFPIWWYTGGVVHALRGCGNLISSANAVVAPGMWLKNIFVPMFGQYDWQGKMVSFVVRLGNVVVRSIVMLIFIFAVFLLFALWVLAPIAIGYMFVVSRLSA